MLRNLFFGLGLETFAKFLRVSVSASEKFGLGKKSRFQFREFWSLKKKYRFRFREIWCREKKYRFRFRKIWSQKKSIGFGFGQNFGIVIQWSSVTWSGQYHKKKSESATSSKILSTSTFSFPLKNFSSPPTALSTWPSSPQGGSCSSGQRFGGWRWGDFPNF